MTISPDHHIADWKPAYQNFVAWCLLFVAVFGCYFSVRRADFVYDDRWTVVENPALRRFDISAYFTNARTVAAPGSGMNLDIYRPLATTSLALDYRAWGLRPRGYHLENLFLHLLNGLLLGWIAYRLLHSKIASLVASAVFLLHPAQVETVAWVTQRSTLLCALGCLAALGIVLRKKPLGAGAMLAATMAWAFGAFSKETAVMLPVLVLMLEPLSGLPETAAHDVRRRRNLALGWFCLAALYWLWRRHVMGVWSSAAGTEHLSRAQLELGLMAFPIYVGKLLVPLALRVSYDTPRWTLWREIGSAGLLVLVLAGWVSAWRRRPFIALALGWTLLMLVPVLHLVPIVAFVAERFLYIPIMGAALGAGWILTRWPRAWPIMVCYLLALAAGTLAQLPSWQGETELWRHAVAVEPTNAFAHAAYAATLADPQAALHEYEEALQNNPSPDLHAEAANNIAWLLIRAGRPAEALFRAIEAARLEPENTTILFTLCSASIEAGDRSRAEEALDRLGRLPQTPPAMLTFLRRRLDDLKSVPER